jgi:hypothetical protein
VTPPRPPSIAPEPEQGPKVDANKLHHVFGKKGRDLNALVTDFGSREAAFEAVRNATQEAVKRQNISGQYEIEIKIHGYEVTVQGTVMDNGTVKIGTIFP